MKSNARPVSIGNASSDLKHGDAGRLVSSCRPVIAETRSDVTLHFSYGSNMDRAAMARRCPGATALGRAILDDHRFLITADGYASVRRVPGEEVHGVLWRLTPRDLAALNAYENIDGGRYSRAMMPVLSDDRRISALVYLGRSRSEGRPKPGYMEAVIAAARAANLPLAYIQDLQRWSPSFRGVRATETGDIA